MGAGRNLSSYRRPIASQIRLRSGHETGDIDLRKLAGTAEPTEMHGIENLI
jgi:hypothetical protein